MMDNWIKVNSASSETKDAIDSIAEVLKDMGIDLVYDDEQDTEAPYYDSIKGDGAWDKLSREQQRNIAESAESGLDLDESIDVAFSEAIQEEGEEN